jgi:tubby-related protein 1
MMKDVNNDSLSNVLSNVPSTTHLTAQEMFQSQREAALKRRRHQFQPGIAGNTNGLSSKSLTGQPRVHNLGQGYNIVGTRSMHGMGQHHSYHESDHTSAPDGNPVFTARYPSSVLHGSPERSPLDGSNAVSGTMLRTPNKCSYSSNERIDEQTTISELTDHHHFEDRSKVGRLTRSPSTLSNLVPSAKQDTRRTITTLASASEGEHSSQRSTVDDDNDEIRGEQEPSAQKNTKNINEFTAQIDWDDVSQIKKFLMEPVPKEAGIIQCYIKRNKKQSRFFPEYRLYMQDDDTFLLSSKKRKKKKSSNYLISMSRNDHYKGSENIIGKLRSNFIGTEYQIYDNGKNPKSQDPFFDEKNEDLVRKELGIILYGHNMTSTKGPRRMNVCISKIQDSGEPEKTWQPENGDDTMLKCFKQKAESAMRDLYFYKNRQPKWNEELSVYVLNFNSRVTMASVKNFQLINQTSDEKEVIMQFGRTGNDEFIMDVQWPMSLFQAFSVSLASCDSKLSE